MTQGPSKIGPLLLYFIINLNEDEVHKTKENRAWSLAMRARKATWPTICHKIPNIGESAQR